MAVSETSAFASPIDEAALVAAGGGVSAHHLRRNSPAIAEVFRRSGGGITKHQGGGSGVLTTTTGGVGRGTATIGRSASKPRPKNSRSASGAVEALCHAPISGCSYETKSTRNNVSFRQHLIVAVGSIPPCVQDRPREPLRVGEAQFVAAGTLDQSEQAQLLR